MARAASPRSGPHAGRRYTGLAKPRLWTPPLRPLTRRTSRGYEVVDFAQMIGEPLLPWQRFAAVHAMELLPDGSYRFRVVLIIVARQNGKSRLKRTVSLWRLYMDGARLVLGVAQDVSLAREQWNYCIDTIKGHPDLSAELLTVRNVNGDEWFKVASGGRYKISAANRDAGRGLSVNELNIDELRSQRNWDAWSSLSKLVMAVPDAQIWAMSNAGDDESVVLNQLRESALAERDPTIGIFEWSAPDDCELDDLHAIRQANPGLGHIISVQAISSARAIDPPAVYRTEVLCQRVDQLQGAIDMIAWRDCKDPQGTMAGLRDRLAACFDVAPDGKHATLAVAAKMPDGRIRAELAGAWASVDEAFMALPELLDRVKAQSHGWFATGPGAGFSPMLRQRKNPVELTGMKAAEACMGLADLAQARQVVHAGDVLLDAHLAAAQKLTVVDGWRFTRRGGGHVDAAYATAGAVQVARMMPERKRAGVRIVRY